MRGESHAFFVPASAGSQSVTNMICQRDVLWTHMTMAKVKVQISI